MKPLSTSPDSLLRVFKLDDVEAGDFGDHTIRILRNSLVSDPVVRSLLPISR
jgi:hypothetical protein